jgi:putative spermidine/putrescine transport system ATP-binding protein
MRPASEGPILSGANARPPVGDNAQRRHISPDGEWSGAIETESSRVQPILALLDVRKVYPTGVEALRRVNLEVAAGEFLTLLGPSGSGKTTLLMIIAGFEQPSEGRILTEGVEITRLPPERRNLGVVFQNYMLFPHMTVFSNIAYPLAARGVSRAERRDRVLQALELVGLERLGNHRPSQISGGQQQRVALARALVYRPRILLLDEPLGALDRGLRERMQIELRRLHQKVGVTFLYVTHDQEEALTMSDRIVVLRNGSVEQVGTPEDIYFRPDNEFVARFVGTANLLPGEALEQDGEWLRVKLDGGVETLASVRDPFPRSTRVAVLIRPEKLGLHRTAQARTQNCQAIDGRLAERAFTGNTWRCRVATRLGELIVHTSSRVEIGIGEEICAEWDPREAWVMRSAGGT